MHRRIKGSEYTTIPGGSHATPAENPDMINMRIDLWLQRHFGDTIDAAATQAAEKTARKAAKKARARAAGKTAKKPAKKKPTSKSAKKASGRPSKAA
jgi:hypothetical protein